MGTDRPERSIKVERRDRCWRGRFESMASPCEILSEADTADAARRLTELAATEAWRIEDKFSRYRPGNIVDRINGADGGAVEVDAETAQLLDFAVTLYELSGGRFDITSGVLRRVWRFDGSDNVPSAAAVAQVMQDVGWSRVTWASQRLTLRPGMEIDLGGIGKEYAVDRAGSLLREATDTSCLVNFGGDLVAVKKPATRKAWTVGVEAVNATNTNTDKLLRLKVGALATSGDARRYLTKDGIRYGHILDPTTGWPVPDAPRSVTVAANTCTEAGMLSTLAMLRGADAEAFLGAQGVRFWCNRDHETSG